jgi:hypothetical protein
MSMRSWASTVKGTKTILSPNPIPKPQIKCHLTAQYLDVIVLILNYTTFENQMALWFTGDAKWRQLHRAAYEAGKCSTFFVFDRYLCHLLLERYVEPNCFKQKTTKVIKKSFPSKIIDKIPRWFRFYGIELGAFDVDYLGNPIVYIAEHGIVRQEYIINYKHQIPNCRPSSTRAAISYLIEAQASIKIPNVWSNLDAIIDLIRASSSTLERVYTARSYKWMFDLFTDANVFTKLNRFTCYYRRHVNCVCADNFAKMPASDTLLVGLDKFQIMNHMLENNPEIKNIEIFPVVHLSTGSLDNIFNVCQTLIPLLPNLENIFVDVSTCASTVADLSRSINNVTLRVKNYVLYPSENIITKRRRMIIFKMHLQPTFSTSQFASELPNVIAFYRRLEKLTPNDPFGLDMHE